MNLVALRQRGYVKMRRYLLLVSLLLPFSSAWSAVAVTDIQAALKSQGFFSGELNGQSTPELAAALKRYQMRNGLQPTGEANDETLAALGLAASAPDTISPEPAPAPVATPAPRTAGPLNLRRSETEAESDARILRQEESRARVAPAPVQEAPAPRAGVVPPPARLGPPVQPDNRFRGYFAGTPYASAPAEVQESTVRRAQQTLARMGLYHSSVDGDPGPATEDAIMAFQEHEGLSTTGRLDLETLAALRLMPVRVRQATPQRSPSRGGFVPPGARRPSVSVWID